MSRNKAPSPSISKLTQLDWDYEGDLSESAFSALHFHPGRFISQIPAALIGRLTQPGDTVLDPFCGSGTTLLEAQRLGRRSIGIDVNPVSILIAKGKAHRQRAERIEMLMYGHLNRLISLRLEASSKQSVQFALPPSTVQGAKWFHHATLLDLTLIWQYIESCRGSAQGLLQFCFSCILMPACNETRHWGYVCDNTRPLSSRRVNVFNLFETAVSKLIEAYKERDQHRTENLHTVQLHCGDATSMLSRMNDESVDLVVTSPPYFGVVDYVKSQRLTMEWFGYDISTHRSLETGARSKRSRLAARQEYLDEIQEIFSQTARVMRRNAYCCIVIGQSLKREDYLDEMEERISTAGLQLELKTHRAIAVGRRQAPSLKEEVLLIYRKSEN